MIHPEIFNRFFQNNHLNEGGTKPFNLKQEKADAVAAAARILSDHRLYLLETLRSEQRLAVSAAEAIVNPHKIGRLERFIGFIAASLFINWGPLVTRDYFGQVYGNNDEMISKVDNNF